MEKDKATRYNTYFMKMALLTAENSYSRRFKVGSVLVKNGRVVATGWNGQPHGYPNCCECEKAVGNDVVLETLPTVIHSEANLISYCAKYGIQTQGTTLYLTLSPCVNCALLILQAGISTVYYHTQYRDTAGIELLRKSGIAVYSLPI